MQFLPFVEPERGGEDIVAAHRVRALYVLAWIGVVLLTPFVVMEFVFGRYALGTAGASAVIALAVNAITLARKQSTALTMGLLVVAAMSVMGLSLATRGIYGALWSYPTVLLVFFAVRRRIANIYCGAMLLIVSAMVYQFFGVEIASRFLLTLALTILNSNVFVSMTDRLQERLLSQTIRDPLTGAYNRRHMDSCLANAIERKHRHGAPSSLLIIDIDHFKGVNDQFGHAAGDDVLKGIVRLITQRARKLDQLFRIGGEEFMLLLPDTTEDNAATLAEDLRRTVAESGLRVGWDLTVSVGVCELKADQPMDSWIKAADDALYRAKAAGRNRVVRHGGEFGELKKWRSEDARAKP